MKFYKSAPFFRPAKTASSKKWGYINDIKDIAGG